MTEPCKVYDKEGNLVKTIEPQRNKFKAKSKKVNPIQEKDIVNQIIKNLEIRFEKEVSCPLGKVDLLTDKLIIEVKEVKGYKAAIGQLLAYKNTFKSKKPLLYLFERNGNYIDQHVYKKIFEFCRSQDILIFIHTNKKDSFNVFLEKYNLK